MIFLIKIYQIVARGSKKIESIKVISANFDFSRNPASRLDCEILERFGAEVWGEGGNNLEKNPRKMR